MLSIKKTSTIRPLVYNYFIIDKLIYNLGLFSDKNWRRFSLQAKRIKVTKYTLHFIWINFELFTNTFSTRNIHLAWTMMNFTQAFQSTTVHSYLKCNVQFVFSCWIPHWFVAPLEIVHRDRCVWWNYLLRINKRTTNFVGNDYYLLNFMKHLQKSVFFFLLILHVYDFILYFSKTNLLL